MCRADYGAERYEKVEIQRRVAEEFWALAEDRADLFHVIDGARAIEDVHQEIQGVAQRVMSSCIAGEQPLLQLWDQPLARE